MKYQWKNFGVVRADLFWNGVVSTFRLFLAKLLSIVISVLETTSVLPVPWATSWFRVDRVECEEMRMEAPLLVERKAAIDSTASLMANGAVAKLTDRKTTRLAFASCVPMRQGTMLKILLVASVARGSLCFFPRPCYNQRMMHLEQRQWRAHLGEMLLFSSNKNEEDRHVVVNGANGDMGRNHNVTSSEAITLNTPFLVLAGNVGDCLLRSDLKRSSGNDGASTGWTSWVDEASAFRVQCCMDSLCLASPKNPQDPQDINLLERRDEAFRWIKWMKACPTPMIFELSPELRDAVNATVGDRMLKTIDSTRDEFLERIGCRLVLLPSGAELRHALQTPAGAMAYGKLLYGGAKRYRLIGKQRRRAGERTLVYDHSQTNSWLQYGGPDRKYEAVDMGPCALMEVVILPKGLSLPLLSKEGNEMSLSQMRWSPNRMFDFVPKEENTTLTPDRGSERSDDDHGHHAITKNESLSGKDHVDLLESSFTSSVGGLQTQIQAIVRRVLDGRVVQPIFESTSTAEDHRQRVQEAETLAALGLQPVRGLLLYGPPGCGKTALAREISKALNAHPPKIVAAPELLDRWVGGSEKLVRELFADAEAELKRCNGDATKSALHVVVIDEIDAVFRKRTAGQDSGLVSRDSCVNQILAKLDGVNALGNLLLIGMTNRRELLDDALLRPGRLEVHVKIPLPDREGRREILQIHFEALRRKGRLSEPLCEAIDGVRGSRDEADSRSLWGARRRLAAPFTVNRRVSVRDLAASKWTGGFSGADIAGLVRCSGSIALARARDEGGGIGNVLITLEDVVDALEEVKR